MARHTRWPTIQLSKPFAAILVALLGTTIAPCFFFWPADMEAEDRRHRNVVGGRTPLLMSAAGLLLDFQF